ncbi:MAG: hypothetical protein JXQ68_06385 [Campylobacterales bacterium]|nr:hypothetical protein [Campylobacterales bacterium]
MTDSHIASLSWRDWIVPIATTSMTLRQALEASSHLKAGQDDIPLIIQLVENQKFDIPGINLFNGAVGFTYA